MVADDRRGWHGRHQQRLLAGALARVGHTIGARRQRRHGRDRYLRPDRELRITDGANGPARVTLATAAKTVVVDSSFHNELFSDVRPGCLSRRVVDGDRRRDLVLWIPGINGLESTTYVSGVDGAITKLDVALWRPQPWWRAFCAALVWTLRRIPFPPCLSTTTPLADLHRSAPST